MVISILDYYEKVGMGLVSKSIIDIVTLSSLKKV
jgi:hypothetical protein